MDLSLLDINQFLKLPPRVQLQLLYNQQFTPIKIVKLYSKLRSLSYDKYEAFLRVFDEFVRIEIGQYGFDRIRELVLPKSNFYTRHLYISFITVRDVTLDPVTELHFMGDQDFINLTVGTIENGGEAVFLITLSGMGPLSDVFDRLEVFLQEKLGRGTERTDGRDLVEPDNDTNFPKLIANVELATNKIDLTALVLYIIHHEGYEVRNDSFRDDDEEEDYIRSCISCDLQASSLCECHKKSYCSQECANKDHY